MWSFFLSIGVFIVLASGAGLWQHLLRKHAKVQTEQVDQEIARSAEVAQRRYVKRYGRASTDLERTFTVIKKS